MTVSSWIANVNGDWNTGSLWSGGIIPNSVSAAVTIDATATVVPYTVTIAASETETVGSLSMNAVNNLAHAEFPFVNIAAELELDGTLIFAAGSAGSLAGSGQTLVHVAAGKKAEILNGGTLNAFFQVAGSLLVTGTNGVYITNEIQALGGTVTINAPIAELGAGVLFDGYFDAHGAGSVINLGGTLGSSNNIVSIATLEGPSFGWAELTLNGVTAAINEWNGTAYTSVESTLTTIGAGATLDVLGGRNYTTANTLTLDATVGTSVLGTMLNLQAGTISIGGGIDINSGIVQGYGTIVNNVVNNSTLIALGGSIGGTLDLIGALTGTGGVTFDLNAETGVADPTPATLVLNSVSAGQAITLNDGNDILVLATPSAFAGTIAAITGGQIVLQGLTATSAVLANGTLVVSNGSHAVDSLALAGSYTGDHFTATGSVITIGAPIGPSIGGTAARQAITDQQTIAPFTQVVIADRNFLAQETVTVTLSATANGTLTNLGGGVYNAATGVYTNSGAAAAVSAALDGLVFVPTLRQVAPGGSVTTGFTISDVDTFSQTASDSTTAVITTASATAPAIGGALGGQVITGPGTIAPFTHVVISDVNFGQTETVTVTPSSATAGTLTSLPGVGTYSAGTGVYTVTGSAAFVTAALNGLVFTPAVTPDQSVTTDFSILDVDTASQSARNTTTSVTATFGSVAPAITVNTTAYATSDLAPISPFASAVVADANIGQAETVTVTLSSAANGTLSNLGGGRYAGGVYTVIGVSGFVSSALAGLVFVPTAHQVAPGSTVTTRFTISDTDTALQSAIGATATVIATAGTVAPTILRTAAAQAISDHGTIAPFALVVIGDANFGQAETVTVALAAPTNGMLSNLGTGSYNAVTGVYSVQGSAAFVSSAVDGLLFVPTPSEVAPGGTVSTRFTISDVDTSLASVTDSTTTVIATAGTVLPTIAGTVANQTVTGPAAVAPFAHVVIADANFGQTETVTVTPSSAANGTLTPLLNAGTVSAGVYTVIGSASAVTTALDGLVFTPAPGQVAPGGTVITDFTIHDTDTASRSANDTTTSVAATAGLVLPAITGTPAGQAINDQGTITPFGTLVIADANFGQAETVTVRLSATANGALAVPGGGSYNASTGVYTDTGTASVVTAALNRLVFTPTPHQIAPGGTISTTFTIQDTDTAGAMAASTTTTVITTAGTVLPMISGALAAQPVTIQGSITPLATVAITDANFGQAETVTVTVSAAANGTLSNLGGGSYNASTGVYTDTGTASVVTAALNGLVFTPAPHQVAPGGTIATTFTIQDTDTARAMAASTTTTVIATAGTVLPMISGALAAQPVTIQGSITPFATVAITDANFGQAETVTVMLSAAANGTLSNLGGGSYNAATGLYTAFGTASAVTAALNGLVFTLTPIQITAGQTIATMFTILDTDTAGATATNTATSATGIVPSQAGQAIAISNGGTLQIDGLASFAATIEAGLGDHIILAGVTATSAILSGDTLLILDGTRTAGSLTVEGTFGNGHFVVSGSTITIAAGAGTPTISGTVADQAASDVTTLSPFAGVTIGDPSVIQTETLTVTSPDAANGALSNLGGGSYDATMGVYTDIGSAAAVTAALDGLVFTPAAGQVLLGQAVTTGFTISDTNTGALTAIDDTTSVVATAVAGDPAADILLQNTDGQMALWEMNGLTFATSGLVGPNPGPTWFVRGSGAFFAGDTSDLLWQNQGGQVAVWQVQGVTLVSAAAVSANPGPSWHIEGTGDFYGDGNTDIVFQNDNGSVALWDMSGTAIVQSGAVSGNLGPGWSIKGTGDFYGDGNTDILFQNTDGSVAIWDMSGAAIIRSGAVSANPGPGWSIKGTGDFYGDGNTDILFQDADGSVAIWDMNGTTIVQAAVVADPGPTWHVEGTGDFNNDGKTDIVFQGDDGSVAIWEMNGAAISASTMVANPSNSWGVLGADENMRFIYSAAANETLVATPTTPDEFVFTAVAAGAHTISGFCTTQDVIELSGAQFASFAAVQAAITPVQGGAMLNLGNSTLLLPGVVAATLHASNFALT